jgi:hypothetical protein
MNELTREHQPRAIAAGMWIGLWAGEVISAGEYWLECAAALGRAMTRRFYKPVLLGAPLAVVFGVFAGLWGFTSHYDLKARCAGLDIKAIVNGGERYRIEVGRWPARLEDMVPGYLKELRSDPWGHPYAQYTGPGGYAVVSAGPDGQLGTADDIYSVVPNPTPPSK